MAWLASSPPASNAAKVKIARNNSCRGGEVNYTRSFSPRCQSLQAQRTAGQLSTLEELLTSGARLTKAAQLAWGQVVKPGDLVVDATCGNGHDTLWMAEAVGASGVVHAFDLQPAAVASTTARLHANIPPDRLPTLHCHTTCHSRLHEVVGSSCARLVTFNLGYLPNGDKSLITQSSSTLRALEAALKVLMPGGLISVLAYTGHQGGQEEYESVRGLLGGLPPSHWVTSESRLLNRPTAPILMLTWRNPGLGERSNSGSH